MNIVKAAVRFPNGPRITDAPALQIPQDEAETILQDEAEPLLVIQIIVFAGPVQDDIPNGDHQVPQVLHEHNIGGDAGDDGVGGGDDGGVDGGDDGGAISSNDITSNAGNNATSDVDGAGNADDVVGGDIVSDIGDDATGNSESTESEISYIEEMMISSALLGHPYTPNNRRLCTMSKRFPRVTSSIEGPITLSILSDLDHHAQTVEFPPFFDSITDLASSLRAIPEPESFAAQFQSEPSVAPIDATFVSEVVTAEDTSVYVLDEIESTDEFGSPS
ncbi:hypothetical protein BGX27_001003, partial [Mortierella sp. AM989]